MDLKINFVVQAVCFGIRLPGKLVTFLTCGVAHKISNYSADKSTMSRDFPFGCAEAAYPFVHFSSSSVSVPSCRTRRRRCLSLALWRVSIGRDRRNLISMKRALGDFIRATSYPTVSPAAAGEMFPRSIIPRTSPELLRRLSVDQQNPRPSAANLDVVKSLSQNATRRYYVSIKICTKTELRISNSHRQCTFATIIHPGGLRNLIWI